MSQEPEVQNGIVQFNNVTQEDLVDHEGRKGRRECPVPKPGGKVGELLGFKKTNDDDTKAPGSS